MATVQRLADSCVLVSTDAGTTLIDPGTLAYEGGVVDLDGLGDVQRVLITHEHADHVHPGFVRWLVDRGTDVAVMANDAVAAILEPHDIEVLTVPTDPVAFEDVVHETTPLGTAPPNRAWTVDGLLTHPGDSYQPADCAPMLALPLITPWGSMFASAQFARRLAPRQVIPIHDFYLSESGRTAIYGLAQKMFTDDDIEFVPLNWGESLTLDG